MCWAGTEIQESEANGTCPYCGSLTLDGYSIDQCSYSPICCDECEWRPCDKSC